jgi:hypothetical protein
LRGGPAPKPWVAHITGTDPKYGLARKFVDAMNDWRDASKAWSGNVYGVVATFALREGNLYEVSRCRGRASKRYVAREFVFIRDRKPVQLEPIEALARIAGDKDPAIPFELGDDPDAPPCVSEVRGIGTPKRLGWIVQGSRRFYRLRVGSIYEICEGESRRFVVAGQDGARAVSENQAIDLLRATA